MYVCVFSFTFIFGGVVGGGSRKSCALALAKLFLKLLPQQQTQRGDSIDVSWTTRQTFRLNFFLSICCIFYIFASFFLFSLFSSILAALLQKKKKREKATFWNVTQQLSLLSSAYLEHLCPAAAPLPAIHWNCKQLSRTQSDTQNAQQAGTQLRHMQRKQKKKKMKGDSHSSATET